LEFRDRGGEEAWRRGGENESEGSGYGVQGSGYGVQGSGSAGAEERMRGISAGGTSSASLGCAHRFHAESSHIFAIKLENRIAVYSC